jgi:SAM-dependent methyltransferase
MIEDKKKWNDKHSQNSEQDTASSLLKNYIEHAHVGHALDIACGKGANTLFLHEKGFEIDAVDISDVALKQMIKTPMITPIEADLDKYHIAPNKYDLIVNVNFLNRRLLTQIKDGLKPGGLLIFETFMLAHGDFRPPTMNLEYLLRKNELLHAFIGLDVIYYEEKIVTNEKEERVKIASLVAKKS